MSNKSSPITTDNKFGNNVWSREESGAIGDILSKKLGKDTTAQRTGAGNCTISICFFNLQVTNLLF